MMDGFRPECRSNPFSVNFNANLTANDSAPFSNSGHGHESEIDQYGGHGEYEEANIHDKPMSKVQVLMQRTVAGWPFYSIIIAIGQLLSAVGPSPRLLSCTIALTFRPRSN